MDSLASFSPVRAAGRAERIFLHWSGGDYETVYDAYHWCVAQREGSIVVVQTRDPAENLRNVYDEPETPYGAHVYRRNSYALGISLMAMKDATPADFGLYPVTDPLIEALCTVASRVAATYGIQITRQTVLTHAEAAVEDGYFGAGEEERWDIARLQPSQKPLTPDEAGSCGDELRSRIERA